MINVLMPMAGNGIRLRSFSETPKPFINVNGSPMFVLPFKSINKDNAIFVVREEHQEYHNIINKYFDEAKIVVQKSDLNGPVYSALLASDHITSDPLIIIDCDVVVKFDLEDLLTAVLETDLDGAIVTSKQDSLEYSYVSVQNRVVASIAEKNKISRDAIAGIYFWRNGKDFVNYAKQLINLSLNTELYISMVYDLAIKNNKKFLAYAADEFYHLGTPGGIRKFLEA